MTIEERAELNLQYERDFCGYNLSDNMVKRAYRKGATEQRAIDHSEEHLAWIVQEFFKWRDSNNPKFSFGEWINVSMEE